MLDIFLGGVGVAIIAGLFRLFETKMNNRSWERGECRETHAKMTKEIAENFAKIRKAQRIILQDRITWLARGYIARDEVTLEDRGNLIEMYNTYHNDLDGNGNLKALMEDVRKVKVV